MPEFTKRAGAALAAGSLAALLAFSGSVQAQGGRIVCWKDASGKVVGCGDKVPPEYQSNATRELDSRGITRKQTESVEEANRRRAREAEAAKTKVEADRKALDQKRQDTALLETFASEKEIDAKRDRDLQVVDSQIEQLNGALKNTTARYNETKGRVEAVEKNKKPVPKVLKDELTRVSGEKQRLETGIASKEKEKEELRVKYSEYRKRYTELRSAQGSPQAAAKK